MAAHPQISRSRVRIVPFLHPLRYHFFSCRLSRDHQIESPAWYPFVLDQLSRSGLQDQLPSAKPGCKSASAPASTITAGPTPAPASTPTPAPTSQPQSQLQEDAVAELLKRNKDVLDELINHPFPRTLGNGTASLDGFRYYMIVSHL